MLYRRFGKSVLKTSVIGFGGCPMGRDYVSFDDGEIVRAVHAAIDAGVTLFDIAAVYGWGEGEKLLGKALKGKRDRVVLVSKRGTRRDAPGGPDRRDSLKGVPGTGA